MSSTSEHTTARAELGAPPLGVRFFHPGGQMNVRPELDNLMGSATRSLRGAVCYMTRPGAMVLSQHVERFKLPGGFFVASIDPPTNLKSLKALHYKAPGHIYIHLGAITPEETKVGRALMHSKVLLAIGDHTSRLWVGSHNMTGNAVMGGNFEAGVEITAANSDAAIHDATSHLEACRSTAELFNPNRMGDYERIQKERWPRPDEISSQRILVIHAEAEYIPTGAPFTVHIRLGMTDYDRMFRVEDIVRLFLYPRGTLCPQNKVDIQKSNLWHGTMTGVVRTEKHPRNRGVGGRFDAADFELDIPDLEKPPVMVVAGKSTVSPFTQVVLRMDKRGEVGKELYSIDSKNPFVSVLDSGDTVFDLHEVDKDMLQYFTPESYEGHTLKYRPVVGMKRKIEIVGYPETMNTALANKWEESDSAGFLTSTSYRGRKPKNPVDSFFFQSRYVITPKEPKQD